MKWQYISRTTHMCVCAYICVCVCLCVRCVDVCVVLKSTILPTLSDFGISLIHLQSVL